MPVLAVSLLGAGRMGHEIMRALAARPAEFRLAGVWVRPDSELLGQEMSEHTGSAGVGVTASSDLDSVLAAADIAIDFSLPAATPAVIQAAGAAATPLVCGVSGLDAAVLENLRAAARSIPLFYDRNMSIGVAVLRRLAGQAGRMLGSEFAADIHDLHHARKLDAPSGTALMLGETLAAARGQRFADVMRYEPDGKVAGRADADIVYHVRREGTWPGTHALCFSGEAESLELRHEVSDRRVFALGALRAAAWLAGRGPGLYDMQDLLSERLTA